MKDLSVGARVGCSWRKEMEFCCRKRPIWTSGLLKSKTLQYIVARILATKTTSSNFLVEMVMSVKDQFTHQYQTKECVLPYLIKADKEQTSNVTDHSLKKECHERYFFLQVANKIKIYFSKVWSHHIVEGISKFNIFSELTDLEWCMSQGKLFRQKRIQKALNWVQFKRIKDMDSE